MIGYLLIGCFIILVAVWQTPEEEINKVEDIFPKVILFILTWPLFLGILGLKMLGSQE